MFQNEMMNKSLVQILVGLCALFTPHSLMFHLVFHKSKCWSKYKISLDFHPVENIWANLITQFNGMYNHLLIMNWLINKSYLDIWVQEWYDIYKSQFFVLYSMQSRSSPDIMSSAKHVQYIMSASTTQCLLAQMETTLPWLRVTCRFCIHSELPITVVLINFV